MIVIQIKTSNDAFRGEEYGTEISNILRKIIKKIDGTDRQVAAQTFPIHLKDRNGNHVCNVYTTEKE